MGQGPRSYGPGRADRPLGLGLVRRIVFVRPAARGVPHASPGPAEPAAARGRLASLGVCRRPRGRQDARRGVCWIQQRVDDGTMKLGCLIAPTAADIRDVMVEGPSGLIAVAPPWNRPRFESSKRRVEWPNGARAVCLSGEEPERARGLNIDTLWADELACWQRAESTWDLAMLALRAGTNPQAMITTTPRRLAVLRRILAEATTVQTTDSTYANQAHLPREFLSQIVSMYENTRLGRQEIYAEFLETTEGVWFTGFDPARHVSLEAEFHPALLRALRDRRRHVAAHGGGVFPGSQPSRLRPQEGDGVWRIPCRSTW